MPTRSRAFTLVEILVGLTIFALAAVSVYTSLHLAIRVFKQQEGRDESLTTALLALDHLSLGLKSAYLNAENEQITFFGTRERVDFYCLNDRGDVELRSWYLTPRGSSEGNALMQIRQPYSSVAGGTMPEPELIHSQVASWSLQYFSAKDKLWYDEWLEPNTLPRLVRIELNVAAGDKPENTVRLVRYAVLMASMTFAMPTTE